MTERSLHLAVKVPIEHIIEVAVEDSDYDTVIGMIKSIDERMADWDFTNRLWAYFAEKRRIFETEVATDPPVAT